MSHSPEDPEQHLDEESLAERCPACDSVVAAGDQRCLMCGELLADRPRTPPSEDDHGQKESRGEDVEAGQPRGEGDDIVADGEPLVIESTLIERQSRVVLWLTIAFAILIVIVGVLMLQNPAAVTLAIFLTETPIPATETLTPTWTALPTETSAPRETPTITPTSPPTETPRPPRSHTVVLGETLFGLSLRYGVSMESIAQTSGLEPNAALQVSQDLLVPWPTATPPLEPVEVEIGGETIIADPTNCRIYEIKGGDTFFGIAARERVDIRAMMAVNRLTEQSVLQPGDTICIPTIIRGGVLPPTPGPSPTATATQPPPGPVLLYPVQEAEVQPPEAPFFLQWSAVKDLADDEWYMVELTDLSAVESHPRRGFTRQTSFRVPETWRPHEPLSHLMRWRVTLVRVVDEREDGSFIYTYGGNSSDDAHFTWLGAVPTATPTPTPTAAITATPQN